MSLNQLVASDRLRPLLESVIEYTKPSASTSVNGGNGKTSLDVTPSIRIKSATPGADPLRKIVDALIADRGGSAAAPIADTLKVDGMGLYFVGAGSALEDDITYKNTRTDADAPSLYVNAREGDDRIEVDDGPPPPPDAAGGNRRSVKIDAGDGSDYVKVSAAFITEVNGGAGDDRISTQGDTTTYLDGGAGDDDIAAFGRVISTVLGGAGDDSIIASGDVVGEVYGGDGDDSIVVSSKGYSVAGDGTPSHGVARVYGGAGDDNLLIGGKAEVFFAAGDGNDYVSIGDTTTVRLGEGLDLNTASIVEEEGKFIITFGEGESIEVESRTGSIYLGNNTDGSFSFYTSEEAYQASLFASSEPDPLTNLVATSFASGDGETVATLEEPVFLALRGDLSLDDAVIEQDQFSVTISWPDSDDVYRIESPSGSIFLDQFSPKNIAFFAAAEQLTAWLDSPAHPANRDTQPAVDPFLSVLMQAHQRARFG